MESGNRVPNKFENSGLTASKSEMVDAPIINEFPLCLECRLIEYQDNEYGCGVIGKVVNVTADEKVMSGDKVDMSLARDHTGTSLLQRGSAKHPLSRKDQGG